MNYQKGITLIKIVVIIIIVIALCVGLFLFAWVVRVSDSEFPPAVNSFMKKYFDKPDINDWAYKVCLGLELYIKDKGVYPPTLEDLVPEYLPSIPAHPSTNQTVQFTYQVDPSGSKYSLCVEINGGSRCFVSDPYNTN